MGTIKEIEKIGFFEEIENKIVLIEWPEKIEKILKKRIDISFIKKKEKFEKMDKILIDTNEEYGKKRRA